MASAKDDDAAATQRRHEKISTAFAPVAVEIGHIIIQWNNLHFMLERMFTELCDMRKKDIAPAIWHTLLNDSAQRDILRAAANVVFADDQPTQEAFDWLITMTDKLAGVRNDATHASLGWTTDKNGSVVISPNVFIKTARTARLRSKDLAKEYAACVSDLHHLYDYAHALEEHSEFPDVSVPLPGKPLLKSIPLDQQKSRKPRSDGKPKSPLPQKSSRG